MKAVQEYLTGVFGEIQGWCIPHLWQCIEPLSQAILEEGPAGPVAEIGVYHGKFFIGLIKTMGVDRGNTAIDVFDLQRFNLDGAGKGNLGAFKTNLARAGIDENSIVIMRADSMSLATSQVAELLNNTGGYSLFSVDGCHLVEHTINDLSLAMELTRPYGIILVDDYYNANWPGVQEGVAKLFYTRSPRFIPLLFTSGKLFLCSISYHSQYLSKVIEFLRQHHPTTRVKRVKRFGYDSLTVMPDFHSHEYVVSLGA